MQQLAAAAAAAAAAHHQHAAGVGVGGVGVGGVGVGVGDVGEWRAPLIVEPAGLGDAVWDFHPHQPHPHPAVHPTHSTHLHSHKRSVTFLPLVVCLLVTVHRAK